MGTRRVWLGRYMIEAQVGEFADGGYWAAEPVTEAIVLGNEPLVVSAGLKKAKPITWFIEVQGVFYALHRSLTPITSIPTLNRSLMTEILAAAGKRPRGRVNGI